MLQRATDRLHADELDAVVVTQHPDVVGDDAERSTKLDGEIARTGNTFPEALKDARAERMGQSLGDPGLRGLPRRTVSITG